MNQNSQLPKVKIPDILEKKKDNVPIKVLTAYDFPCARLVDEAGVDMILVGDSLAMTVLGYPDTVSVTMDEMIHHCKAVARGAERALLIGDMPFLSYQVSVEEAIKNAGRFIKEGHMDAVKLEGGESVLETVRRIVDVGIPVIGHVGLTPQTATKLGGYKVQARTARDAKRIYKDAIALEEAGCFAVVLEAIPARVAEIISRKLAIPTIGIGAGVGCDGQVLVFHDLLGFYGRSVPRFVKIFADARTPIREGLKDYCRAVEQREFPAEEHGFKMKKSEFEKFTRLLDEK